MGLPTRRRGVMLINSLMMAVIFSMIAVMVMRWVLGRHMLSSSSYKSSQTNARSQGYALERSAAWQFDTVPDSGSREVDGQTISYERTTAGIPGTPGTPGIPATPGTPAIPGTPGTPFIPGTPEVPATPDQPAVATECVPDPGESCAGFAGTNPPVDDAGCDSSGCDFVPGQAYVAPCPWDEPIYVPCGTVMCYSHTVHHDDGTPPCYRPRIENQCNRREGDEDLPVEGDGLECAEGEILVDVNPPRPYIPGTPYIPATPDQPAVPATPDIPAVPATDYVPPIPGTPGTETNKVVFTVDDD